LCKFSYECLIINSSYHNYISFILNSLPYSIMSLLWLIISYSCTFFTLSMWTYHRWFGYPLMFEVFVQEWTYCTYNIFRNIVTTIFWRLERIYQIEVSHLFPYHIWRQMNIFITRDSFWTLMDVVIAYYTPSNIPIICIIHNCACNDSCYLWKDKIIYGVYTKIKLHSPCYRDLWLSSFLFQFLFYYLCSCHYNLSSNILFNSHNAYFLLLTVCP
jgi:hypothetical protein